MKDLLDGIITDATAVLLSAIALMAIAFVIMTWIRTRSLVPTLGSLLLGAVVLAGVSRYATLKNVAEEDIDRYTDDVGEGVRVGDG